MPPENYHASDVDGMANTDSERMPPTADSSASDVDSMAQASDASVALQAGWRRRSSRREAERRRDARRLEATRALAVQRLQSVVRRRKATRSFHEVVVQATRHRAASRIQRAWRRHIWLRTMFHRSRSRLVLKRMLSEHERVVAAEVLQVRWRQRASPRGARVRVYGSPSGGSRVRLDVCLLYTSPSPRDS